MKIIETRTKIAKDFNLSDEVKKKMLDTDAEWLVEYMRRETVGKLNTDRNEVYHGDSKKYFIPTLKFGPIQVSMQVAYYIWYNRFKTNKHYEALITEEEFEEVMDGPYAPCDVQIRCEEKNLLCTQLKAVEVEEILCKIAKDDYLNLLDYEQDS